MNRFFSRAALIAHEKLTGRQILKRLEELNRTQWLSREELEALQRQKLHRIIQYAYQYVPYYHKVFDAAGFHPGDLYDDWDAFKKIPILTKAIIRKNRDSILTADLPYRRSLSQSCTSGSTGEPLVFMQDSNFRDSVTADVQRHLGWSGCNLGDLHALIWCAAANPDLKWIVRTRLIDLIWNRLRFNSYKMTESYMKAATEVLHAKKPKVLFGFGSDLYHFARFVKKHYENYLHFGGIFSTAETLMPSMRYLIEEAFHCRVFDRYGTLELGGIGCECIAHNGYHVSVENNYVEILNDETPTQPGELGNIVVTNLNNRGMPFIRYDLQDAGSWFEDEKCLCGRESPRMKSVEGRLRDGLLTQDGRLIFSGFSGHAFHCLAHPTIKQFQVIQKNVTHIVVRLVQDGLIPENITIEIIHAFKGTFGDNVKIEIEVLDELPKLPSGKHLYVMSEIDHGNEIYSS